MHVCIVRILWIVSIFGGIYVVIIIFSMKKSRMKIVSYEYSWNEQQVLWIVPGV